MFGITGSLHGDLRSGLLDLTEIAAASSIETAPTFSSSHASFVEPGMGTIQAFWASSHASAAMNGRESVVPVGPDVRAAIDGILEARPGLESP